MIDLSVGNWDAISVAELWAEREVCTSAPSTPAPILADHWSGALAQMRHTHETRICCNMKPRHAKRMLKPGSKRRLHTVTALDPWTKQEVGTSVFNGFFWPGIHWFESVSLVAYYVKHWSDDGMVLCHQRSVHGAWMPKLGAEVDPQTGIREQTVERQHLLTSRLCASPSSNG